VRTDWPRTAGQPDSLRESAAAIQAIAHADERACGTAVYIPLMGSHRDKSAPTQLAIQSLGYVHKKNINNCPIHVVFGPSMIITFPSGWTSQKTAHRSGRSVWHLHVAHALGFPN
jgi:hypothetical protein